MMSQVIMEDLQSDHVPASITISRVENTNLLEMRVTSSNAQDAYDVAQSVLDNYGQVTNRVMSDVSMVVLDQPLLATGPDAYPDYLRSAIKGAVKAKGLPIDTSIHEPAVQLTDEQYRNIQSILK